MSMKIVVMMEDVRQDGGGRLQATHHVRINADAFKSYPDLAGAWELIEQHDMRVSHGTWYTSHGVSPSVFPNKSLSEIPELKDALDVTTDAKSETTALWWGTEIREDRTDVSMQGLPLRLKLEARDLLDENGKGPFAQVFVYG